MGEIGGCAQCFRILLVVVNIIFMLIGLALLAVGIYLAVVGNDFAFLTGGSSFTSGAALLIIGGVITVVITALGILGAIGLWRPILVIYLIALVILVLLEIVAGILGFVYREQLVSGIDARFDAAIGLYRADQDAEGFNQGVNDAVSFVQGNFACCGSTGPQSWIDLNRDAVEQENGRPPLCADCNVTTTNNCQEYTYETTSMPIFNRTFNALNQGCVDSTRRTLEIAAYTVGGVGIAFGIVEIIGVLIALGLICVITKSREQTVV